MVQKREPNSTFGVVSSEITVPLHLWQQNAPQQRHYFNIQNQFNLLFQIFKLGNIK